MKYKVGDKVRVRKNVRNGDYLICNAEDYKGKIFTIENVFSTGSCCLKEDTIKLTWSDEMLEPVEDIIEYKGKKYDVVYANVETFDLTLHLEEHKEEDKKIEKLNTQIDYTSKVNYEILDKINELIDEVNKLKEEK